MTPEELERFVNQGPTSMSETMPAVGYRSTARSALYAFAVGKKIAVFTGDEGDPSVYIYSTAEKLSEIAVVLHVLRPFPSPEVVFARINHDSPDFKTATDAADDLNSDVNGEWESLRARAVAAMDETQVWEDPPRTVTVHYSEWLDFDGSDTKMVPRSKGIVVVSEDGQRLVGIAFPGFEEDTRRWSHYKNLPSKPNDALNAVSDMAGRSTMLSDPKEMNGHSWEDAVSRALYAYGEFIYNDTHRSAFK